VILAEDYTFLFNLDAQLLFDTALLAVAVFFLFIGMSYLLFNPARKLLKDRQDRIENDITSAKEDKESAAALKAEYEGKLKEIDKEAEAILSEARQKALKNENRIIEEAKEEASRIIKRAQEEAELEKKHAADDVKKEMIQVASLMAQKVVAASMTTQIQDTLVEETLREMGDSTWLS
jgi:F-type H+-transporting ATPase subunit b